LDAIGAVVEIGPQSPEGTKTAKKLRTFVEKGNKEMGVQTDVKKKC